MPIAVTCPGCGQVTTAPDEWAGIQVHCHNCQVEHTVPVQKSPGSGQLGDAEGPPVRTDQPPAREAPSRAFRGIVDRVFEGMGQALSVRKLTFFLLSAITAFVVWGLLIRTGFSIGTAVGFVVLPIANSVAVGLSGVIVGGVAYLAIEEGQGRTCRVTDALAFCRRQFVALFFGTILLAVGVGLAGGMVNGLVALLNQSRTVGSLVGSLLFVPQVLANGALVVVCLVGVLVPCSVAVEQLGPIQAIRRLTSLLVQRPGGLLLQFGITLYLGVMMLFVLAVLATISLGPTLATNGPSPARWMPFSSTDAAQEEVTGLFANLQSLAGLPGMEGIESSSLLPSLSPSKPAESPGRWGDWLRELGIGVVFIAVLAFPVVFWICAFARYYESLTPTVPTLDPETKTPPAPPPLPTTGGDGV